MSEEDIIVKCCCCQRISTDLGWEYEVIPVGEGKRYSHGYCPVCLEAAVLEVEELACKPESMRLAS